MSSDRAFATDCRTFDRQSKRSEVGDRHTSEMAVQFYLKWRVYPIPEFLLNDHNFRVSLEQAFTRQQRVMIIPVSPLTTLKDVIHSFRTVAKQIRRPRKVPNLRVMRVALLYHYLIVHSAFHAFKPSDFAAVHGSKPRKRGKRLAHRKGVEIRRPHYQGLDTTRNSVSSC